jgi:hypothetical protein
MSDRFMEEQLELDEASSFARRRIPAEVDSLVLENPRAKPVDEVELGARLAKIPGIERVRLLEVNVDSQVRNLRFLAALPKVNSLVVHGYSLETLDGIASFRGKTLSIDTGRNKKRDLSGLVEMSAQQLVLEYAKTTDIEALATNRSLRVLHLHHAPFDQLDRLAGVPLAQLALAWCKGDTFDLAPFRQLGVLQLHYCRKLARLTGRCDASWVLIETCNELDLSTLRCLPRLQHLIVMGRKQPVPLSLFAGHAALESVMLGDSRLEVDTMKLGLPKLRALSANRLSSEQAEALSRANSGVEVSGGRHQYLGGARTK